MHGASCLRDLWALFVLFLHPTTPAATRRPPAPLHHQPHPQHRQKRTHAPTHAPFALKSPHTPPTQQVIDLAKTQEQTKAAEAKAKAAEYEAYAKQASVEAERVRAEETRKTLQADAAAKAQLAQYNDELARKRVELEHERARARNAELVALQEEGVRRAEAEKARTAAAIEAERRATEQYRAELEAKVAREKALAEADGRIKEGRANEDVATRALRLRLSEEKDKALASIAAVFDRLGAGTSALLEDKAKLTALVVGGTALAAGVYSAREGARLAGRALDAWLGTPALVRETSLARWWRRGSARAAPPAGSEAAAASAARGFADIILPPSLGDRVRALAASTATARAHGAPFRHALFHGPPGTGKSLAAARLARTAGLDYAILSGGDVGPLGHAAAPKLHALFDWAEASPRGLLLFIDEADAFLGRRHAGMGEDLRGALNACLFRTGAPSHSFSLVLATNRPSDLDPAVLDRMDEAVLFPLPGTAEREAILRLYLARYVGWTPTSGPPVPKGSATRRPRRSWADALRGRGGSPDPIKVDPAIDDAAVAQAAADTAGFSGRELAKLASAVQAAAYGTPGAALSAAMFRAVVAAKVEEHGQRRAFAGEAVGGGGPALAMGV
jgi:ATPase family AAA domain-containing protein 3A/B